MITLATDVLEIVEKEYGLSLINGSISRLNSQDDRAIWKVETNEGFVILRTFNTDHPKEEVKKDLDILKFLEENDYPAPRLIKTKKGMDFIMTQGNYRVAISSYIEGIPGNHAKTPATFKIFGAMLAKLHTLGESTKFHLYGHKSRREPSVTIPGLLTEIEVLLATDTVAEWQDILEELKQSLVSLPNFSRLPISIIHTDAWEGNLILTPEGEGILIDWYNAGLGIAIADVGYTLTQTCLWPESDNSDQIVILKDLINPFIENYQLNRKFTDQEIEYLPDAMKYANYTNTTTEILVKIRNKEDKAKVLAGSANWKKFKNLRNNPSSAIDFIKELLST